MDIQKVRIYKPLGTDGICDRPAQAKEEEYKKKRTPFPTMPCVAFPRCAVHIEAAVCCGVRSQDGSHERRLFFTYYIRMTVSRNACSQLLVDMSVYCG